MALTTQATVDIEKLVHGGEGLGRLDGQVVLVPYVLPGERVSLISERVKSGLLRGSATEVLQASPERVVPRCEYFTACGGCHLQHAAYGLQLEQKRAILRETLQRLGGIRYTADIPVTSGEPWSYRNRVQLHFKDGKCGFHRAASHEIEPIDHCHISSPMVVETIARLAAAAKRAEWPKFLRSLEVFTNESEVQLTVLESNQPVAARFFEWTKTFLPVAQSAIEYPAAGYVFRISRGSFFQTNRFLIEALVQEAIGGETGGHAVDLYAGAGLFSLPLARSFERVDAIERGGPAFRDLEWNATRDGASRLTIRRASAEEFLRELTTPPELIVADPPRSGLGSETVKELLRLRPARLTVVSCDASTLARDLKKLLAGGFQIAGLRLVDLFPQTYHFETIASLES